MCNLARVWSLTGLFLFTAGSPQGLAAISQIVVFGDSLSDTGNVLQRTQATSLVSDRPANPWYDTGRWTNGPSNSGSDTTQPRTTPTHYSGVWHEQLAARLGIPPATNSLHGGTNWAYGGAVSGTGTFTLLGMQNVGEQVASYLKQQPLVSDSSLIAIWGGANDVRDAAHLPQATPESLSQIAAVAVENLVHSIEALAGAGATSILWPNLPPLELLPEASSLPASTQTALATAARRFHDDQLKAIATLTTQHPTLQIVALDVYGLMTRTVQHPSDFGLLDVTHSVITTADFSALQMVSTANDPLHQVDVDGFLFWDQIHPTSRVHDLIAAEAYQLVPEPSGAMLGTWLLIHFISRPRRLAARRPGRHCAPLAM